MATFGFYGLNYGKTVEDMGSLHATRRLTSIEFSFDPCNIYRDGPRGVGYPADACSVGDSHPSCFVCVCMYVLYVSIYLWARLRSHFSTDLHEFGKNLWGLNQKN